MKTKKIIFNIFIAVRNKFMVCGYARSDMVVESQSLPTTTWIIPPQAGLPTALWNSACSGIPHTHRPG